MPKDEKVAEDLIAALEKLGPVTGENLESVRDQLGLGEISMGVFQSTVWHLINDDRANPKIRMHRPHLSESRLSLGERPVTLKLPL